MSQSTPWPLSAPQGDDKCSLTLAVGSRGQGCSLSVSICMSQCFSAEAPGGGFQFTALPCP